MTIVKGTSKISNESGDNKVNMKAWNSMGVPQPVIKALEDQKFEAPTAIQALTLPPAIMGRRDILGAAETGSGKTLAFGIPIIAGILNLKLRQPETHSAENKPNKSRNKVKKGKLSNGWLVTDVNAMEEDSGDSGKLLSLQIITIYSSIIPIIPQSSFQHRFIGF